MKRKSEAEARESAALHTAANLRAAAHRGAKDGVVLQKQVQLLAAEMKEASCQMEVDRQRYAKHLGFLRAQLRSIEQHVEQAAR
jgi:hypothetical protein